MVFRRSAASLLLVSALSILAAPSFAENRGTAAIQALSSARWPRQRVSAAVTIARLRPPGGREALESALDDTSPGVRRAAADSLMRLADPQCLPALERHLGDPSPQARGTIRLAYRRISGRTELPTASAAPPPRAPTPPPVVAPPPPVVPPPPASTLSARVAPAPVLAPPAPAPVVAPVVAPVPVAPARPVDWARVRFVIGVGAINNRATSAAMDADYTRECLRRAIQGDAEFALHPGGALPAAANARIRTGALRSYSLEGALQSLQRQQAAGQVSVRAELALIILSEPAHSILGTLSTAATAQEPALTAPNAPDPTPRLTRSAIEVATRGAVERFRSQFAPPRRGRGRAGRR